jgi:hypothetical protein
MYAYWLVMLGTLLLTPLSASARISKGQGYQGYKKGREQFWPKRAICVVQGKTSKMDRISLLLWSIKCFSPSKNA